MRIKIVSLLLVAIMLMSSVVGCTPSASDSTSDATVELNIVKDGSSKYSIVYPKYESTDGTESVAHIQAKKIATAISNVTGVELNVVSDDSVSDYEILVGACNRTEYVAVKRTKNYSIAFSGKKLVVSAGSDDALVAATDALIAKAAGENTFDFAETDAINYTYAPENAIADGATDVIFVPDLLVEYMKVKYSKKMVHEFAVGDADLFMPNPITLAWQDSGEDEFVVLLAENAEFENAIKYRTKDPYVDVINLKRSCEYYWKVQNTSGADITKVFTFATSYTQPRTILVEGVRNIRDIGGYVTEDGLKRIKQGVIYRSASLDNITEAGADMLINVLGIKTDLDLRNATEGEAHEVQILKNRGVKYYNASVTDYYKIFDNEKFPNEYLELGKAFKILANPDNYPIIFHCAIGTDRTGTFALVLQSLCGVNWKETIREYELSYFADVISDINHARIDYIHRVYELLKNYESRKLSLAENTEAFLLDLGVTQEEIDTIREMLLEDVQ